MSAQGFPRSAATTEKGTPGWRRLRSELERMSVLQIDAINTVIRSHYTPLFSRLGHYERSLLDKKLFARGTQKPESRQFYEYWGHECSVMPIALYPLLQWRRQDAARGIGVYQQIYKVATEEKALLGRIRREVAARGALSCADIESDARGPGMWEWSKSKTLLEYLFWTGELASAGRRQFRRLYATPQEVIPARYLDLPQRCRLDDQMTLLEIAARALGVATEADLRDYFRLAAADAKKALGSLLEARRLVAVRVEGWQQLAYTLPDIVVPRSISACTLLSPFDPVVWCRQRVHRLFDFVYRIEIYVPADKRRYGYWVMPFLLDEQLLARVDLKADREAGELIVNGAWAEAGAAHDATASALHRALHDLARWLDLDRVVIRRNGDLCRLLAPLAGTVDA